MKIPTMDMELWLLRWSESNNGGFTVTFAVEPGKEDYFKSATARKGKLAGQRYQVVLVQLNDQDEPDPQSVPATKLVADVPAFAVANAAAIDKTIVDMAKVKADLIKGKQHFPGGLCGLAVRWCDEDHFQFWLAEQVNKEGNPIPDDLTSEWAKGVILAQCGITSRKELDTNAPAAEHFRRDIMTPYVAARKEDGVDVQP